jgi:Rrf2 family protein
MSIFRLTAGPYLGILVLKYIICITAMNGIINISEAASLALHSVAIIASLKKTASVSEISARLGVSEAHLAKVLQRLAKNGLVKSTRGPRGGFTLDRKGESISLLDVYEAIEGPLESRSCLLEKKSCRKGKCILGNTMQAAALLMRNHLQTTRISDLGDIYAPGGMP